MKIDFSDYKSFTEKDIICINNIGIEYTAGKISFAECCNNFRGCHSVEENYIGEFDCSGNPSIGLYTAPHTTHFFFIDDVNMLYQTIKTINECGYKLMDVRNLY